MVKDFLLCEQYPSDQVVKVLSNLLLELYSKSDLHIHNDKGMAQIHSDPGERVK